MRNYEDDKILGKISMIITKSVDFVLQITIISTIFIFFFPLFMTDNKTNPTNHKTETASSKKTETTASKSTENTTSQSTMSDIVSSIPSSDQIEKKIDTVAEDLTQKIESVVSPEISTKTQHITSTLDRVIDQIETITTDIVDLIPVSTNTASNACTVSFKYEETISRLFIFRRLWLIPQSIILHIRSIWIVIIFVIFVLSMLLMGKRNLNLYNRLARYIKHNSMWASYLVGLTDKRPDLFVK